MSGDITACPQCGAIGCRDKYYEILASSSSSPRFLARRTT
ncbi:MAG: hypothetical protein A4E28_02210 [Methanocella sp. PtaU1.Bin125]|nr:MAG: hypothetical protein A4E28_02210 [Methanocella sp. PtaU1.Bin125]